LIRRLGSRRAVNGVGPVDLSSDRVSVGVGVAMARPMMAAAWT